MVWTPQKTTLSDCARLLAEHGNLLGVFWNRGTGLLFHFSQKSGTVAPSLCSKQVSETMDLLIKSENDNTTITRLSYDSRDAQPGTLFFCKGAHFKPEYLAQAVKSGAVAYVSEQDYTEYLASADLEPPPALLVREIRPAIAEIAACFYRGLLEQLTIVGFTGTKGKSTATYLLKSILNSWLAEQGKPGSAWLSGIENYDGVSCAPSLLTTQDILELYAHFKNAVDSGIEYLTMEVSSQALKYGRTHNVPFEVAGFLNIGEDHISDIEHPNHEDYLASKLKIFEQSKTAVINRECDVFERALKAAESCERILTYGRSNAADIVATEISSTPQGISFLASSQDWQRRFALPMTGLFNVENALAAITAALALGIPLEHIEQGLAHSEVSGRMQLMAGPENKLIIIDYAHNKLSFETIFATVAEEHPERPISCVFGATGSKGLERRLDLPAVAVMYSDNIYITEDDPLEEPLAEINEQIAQVVRAAGKTPLVFEDRSEAIKRAITDSPAGSIILVLGK
ncbi:MAG: UDP-N-acetylmuramoyl-L-alanyl-D-glutamate--2,6-diaminopimelate ligase, partial [Coriobacteriia bacterium]|nr:UDP-N-acetylmuramoyl-L-alanyl-D-glutamate--2,6-diaminopimelate ligase [Coriobacteriia bacterium]